MKDKLLSLAAKLFAPKLIRNLLAAAGGFLASHGMVVDDGSVLSLVGGGIALLIATIWSAFTKTTLADDDKAMISKLAQALASQAIAFLAGWLQHLGYEGAIDDAYGVSLFATNYGLSALSRPDPKEAASPQVVAGRGNPKR